MGKSKASDPAKINISNIKGVIQSLSRKVQRNISGFELDEHIYEQIIWRRTEVEKKSPKCWNENECKICGCDVLGKTMEDRSCEGKCYTAMMNKEEWEEYKIINNIKLFD